MFGKNRYRSCVRVVYSFFVLLFIVIIWGCEPEVLINQTVVFRDCVAEKASFYHPGNMSFGRVAGLKNCLPFQASIKCTMPDKQDSLFTIEISTFKAPLDTSVQKELLSLQTNKLQVDSSQSFAYQTFRIMSDEGEIQDSYDPDLHYAHNRILVSSIDTISNTIHGWFECRFLISPDISSGENPDTIHFQKCHFEVLISS